MVTKTRKESKMKQGDVYKSKLNNVETVIVIPLAINETNDKGMVIYTNNGSALSRQMLVSSLKEFLENNVFVRNLYGE